VARVKPRIAVLGALAVLGIAAPAHGGETPRWPRWPTEVDRAAAPLRKSGVASELAPDNERSDAVIALEAFATPVLEPWILLALDDPATSVKREALRVCYERELASCIAPATELWRRASEPALRMAALRVVALDPQAERLDLLLAALREDTDTMRAQAAQILGWAPTKADGRTKVRDALVAKLGDMSALVRQQAVESLGMIGDREATLPVARLLEDHEPQVQTAAAHALGNLGDPRAVSALLRLAAAPGETAVLRAALAALVRLPGDRVATALLAAFDEPPPGLTTPEIAELVGLRADPEPTLLRELVERLREPGHARQALRALVLMGTPAVEPLRAALQDRALPPDVALEAERALRGTAALVRPGGADDDAPTEPPPPVLVDTIVDRMRLAARRVEARDLRPGAALEARLAASGPAQTRMAELAAVAVSTRAPRIGRHSRLAWARVIGWARDRTRPPAERCLSTLALGLVERRAPGHDDARRTVLALLADSDPGVRACAAASIGRLTRDPSVRQLAFVDPDPRVRTMAIFAAWTYGMDMGTARRIAVLRLHDDSPQVRAAARFVRDRDLRRGGQFPRPKRRAGHWLEDAARPFPWARSSAPMWMTVELEGTRLWVPTLAAAGRRFAIVPGLAGAIVAGD